MAFDSELMLRAASAGNLTADETGTYKNLGAPIINPLVVRIVVPAMAEANDTIVVTINLSVDGVGVGDITIVLPTITKANVDLGVKEYFFTLPPTADTYQYVSADLNITDADVGGDFNAGAVQIGLVPAGRYNKR
jgi:hypothetical protein